MRATYHALCEHGYADLTVQRIGEAFRKSKSLIYHHYDGKDDLLLDLLEYLLERFEEAIPDASADDPLDRLRAILDHTLATSLSEERRAFAAAMVDLRAQATHDERYQGHFTRHDQFLQTTIAATLEAGVDEGVFSPIDVDAVATFLMTVVTGSLVQRVTADEDATRTVRRQVSTYVHTTIVESR